MVITDQPVEPPMVTGTSSDFNYTFTAHPKVEFESQSEEMGVFDLHLDRKGNLRVIKNGALEQTFLKEVPK